MYPKWKILIAILMAASVLLSSCAGNTATPAPATVTAEPVFEPTATESVAVPLWGDVLTVVISNTPPSLDPGMGEPAFENFITPAYDALLKINPSDGTIMPSLALTWYWVGTDFKTFKMELRPNVFFSDGSEFNAEAVKAWVEFQKANASVTATNIGLDSAEVTGPLSITLHLAQPNSLLPTLLTRNWISGAIACPAAITNPDLVATATCGAGPYMLDTANTVTGDTYTYIPNPNYWNPDAIHWNKLVLKVITNPQSALDALRTGQAQLMAGDGTLVDPAVAAGMTVTGVELNVMGLNFLYKDGTAVPALGDVRVRQALNYAIDRVALAKVLGGGLGRPVSSEFLPGSDAYDASLDDYYPYDPEKAKTLLAEAGYANGFEVSILSVPLGGADILAQAVASYWEAIGVTTIVDNKATTPEFLTGTFSGEYACNIANLGVTIPTLLLWKCCIMPGSFWNRDASAPAELQALIDQLAMTNVEDMAPIARQVNQYLTENAWYVPVHSSKLYFFYAPGVTGGEPTSFEAVINLLEVVPSE